jgi:transcription initiation factor TFIID subunit 5
LAFLKKYSVDMDASHADDLALLETLRTPQAVQENERARNYREYRYTLELSSYSFELMLIFLHESGFNLLLSMICADFRATLD